jgi:murein DD-endopeptidase MepM/ murein hydrolase activator NlpD
MEPVTKALTPVGEMKDSVVDWVEKTLPQIGRVKDEVVDWVRKSLDKLGEFKDQAITGLYDFEDTVGQGLESVLFPFGYRYKSHRPKPPGGDPTSIGAPGGGPGTPGSPTTDPGFIGPLGSDRTVFPVQGFTGRVVEPHHGDPKARGGADIFAPAGTPVLAMVGGKVEWANNDPVGGFNVGIRGEDNLTYYYAHLRENPEDFGIRAGGYVTTGQRLGSVGNTGNAANTPAHLHLGVGTEIQRGAGSLGGTGAGYDLTGRLNQVLTGTTPRPAATPSPIGAPQMLARERFRPHIEAMAQQYGLDPALFLAHLAQESGWSDLVISGKKLSPAGAYGIAQFMPATMAEQAMRMFPGMEVGAAVERFRSDPMLQIQGSADYLSRLKGQFGGSDLAAIAAYNMGPGAYGSLYQKFGGEVPVAALNDETRGHIASVTQGAGRSVVVNIGTLNANGVDSEAARQFAEQIAGFVADGLEDSAGNAAGTTAIRR